MAINGEKVLAIIPARAGSKRCPGKNRRKFRGKYLIEWSLAAAAGSRYIDHFFVSTDDDVVASVMAGLGYRVKERPPELATDDAMNEDVLRYEIPRHMWADSENMLRPYEWVVLLQPTSPLRTSEDIDACIERAQMGDGCITYSTGNWQKNGAVYVARREWIEKHDFSHAGLMKLYMPEERSLDIDYEADFDR